MLYPQSNPFRQCIDLSGFWDLRFDPDDAGGTAGWEAGFDGGYPCAVPASWNDQFDEWRDYVGQAWYQTKFDLPWGWNDSPRRIHLRFNSVNYMAEVWLNGVRMGQHEGGHLPFAFDVTPHVRSEDNRLVVRVEGRLTPDRVPPGNVPADPHDAFPNMGYPPGSFDFFPFCGIHRPVLLSATAPDCISDLTVISEIQRDAGLVRVRLDRVAGDPVTARFTLCGHGAQVSAESDAAERVETELRVPEVALWAPGAPHLYSLTVDLMRHGETLDRYSIPVGIRTVSVEGDAFLLNGQPIHLRGFGRHEDFPVTGRGLVPAVIVKDYALMRWVGANSFRTTHYPYSEQMMDLADRLGFLVIDETPAVGLFFREEGLERRLSLCRRYTQELIERDKNHPSVIMWSLANEPHSNRLAAKPFFRNLYDLAKALDGTRPLTLVSYLGTCEESFEFLDVVCLNRYSGWYSESGQIEEGCARLSAELDDIHQRYPKPLMMTEFGADAIAGWHAEPPEMFSEEYQARMLSRYIEVMSSKPFVVGQHVWNLCDFKTAQAVHRVGGMNLKGVFTRDRRPKLAAHRLRELWSERTTTNQRYHTGM